MPKPAYTLTVLLAALAVSLTGPSDAHAQRATALDEPYIAAKLTLGLGGTATVGADGPLGRGEVDRSLEASFGVAGQYMHPLHQYFAVGGLFGLQTWRSTADGDGGRNLVFDLAVLPQGKYELIANQLEVNVTIPIGLALNMWNELDARSQLRLPFINSASIDGGTGLGFMFGFLVGARYQVIDSLGLLLELGYIYRTVGHTVTAAALGSSAEYDVDLSWGQFALNLGVYF